MAEDLQIIKLGDTAQKVYTTLLVDEEGEVPADLTDCEVYFCYRHIGASAGVKRVATIIPPGTNGEVEYQWVPGDTPDLGDYISDWLVNFPDGSTLRFPNENYHMFRVIAPVGDGQPFTPIAMFREWVRTYLLDNHPTIRQYESEQIDQAVRMAVQMLRARGMATDLSMSQDDLSIIPAVGYDDPVHGATWALIILHAAKRFLVGNSSTSSYRTRALSETFGDRREQVFNLLSEVYELENGEGAL